MTEQQIIETLQLLPWWGWLLAYLPVGFTIAHLSLRVDEAYIRTTGEPPDEPWGGKLMDLLFLTWIVFAFAVEHTPV